MFVQFIFSPFGFPQGAAVVAGKAPKDGAGAEGLQKEGGWTALTETPERSRILLDFSSFSAVFEESIDAGTAGQSSRPKLPWHWFLTGRRLHTQQT